MNILKNIIFFFLGLFYHKPKQITSTSPQDRIGDDDETNEEDFYPIGHA